MSNSQAAKKAEVNLDLDSDERTICFCHCVSAAVIKAAIAAGSETIEAIQAETCASTGCGGCEQEVRELLEAELKSKSTIESA